MIGEEVRRVRLEVGLTGADLAVRSGLSPAAISLIEAGKRDPRAASIVGIARALGVHPGDLFATERNMQGA